MVWIYLLWIVASLLVGYLGRHRRIGFWGFSIAAFFFSPLLVVLVLILTAPTDVAEGIVQSDPPARKRV